jgi:CRISPR-associated protein Cas2
MVFFDLPVGTKPQRYGATRFRNFLKDDGFLMLQYSVYARICRAEEAVDKHLKRLVSRLPSSGSVRALQVTDRQFSRMQILLGDISKTEKSGSEQMILL